MGRSDRHIASNKRPIALHDENKSLSFVFLNRRFGDDNRFALLQDRQFNFDEHAWL